MFGTESSGRSLDLLLLLVMGCLLFLNSGMAQTNATIRGGLNVLPGLSLTYSSEILQVSSQCRMTLYRSPEPTNVLYTYEYLLPGQAIAYADDTVVMQADCNLVFYRAGRPIWSSNTSGRGVNCVLTMQDDGNVVIYQGQTPVWSTQTGGMARDFYVLVLGRDGNLAINGPAIWASKTNKYDSEMFGGRS